MEISKLNITLNNSNFPYRNLSYIDTIIIASVMVKLCREKSVCVYQVPNINIENF